MKSSIQHQLQLKQFQRSYHLENIVIFAAGGGTVFCWHTIFETRYKTQKKNERQQSSPKAVMLPLFFLPN
jgi:hypothetical protein